MKTTLLALSMSLPLMAGPLGGPVPGFVLDSRNGTLRPVMGIPGAMQLGAALSLPFQVRSADFPAYGNVAVVVSDEKPSHLYIVQDFSSPAITDMGTVADNSSILGLNKNGQTAVIVAPGQLQFLSGINGSPVLSNAIPTQALLGQISAGAVDDAGQCALLGTASDSAAAFENFCADGTTQRLFAQDGVRISSIALIGQDAYIADSSGKQILRVTNYPGSANLSVLASAQDGIRSPVALQVIGQQLIVADSAASSVFILDLSGQAGIQVIPLFAAPARLKPLADISVILLNDTSSAPFTIFDLQTMQSFFIPTN